MQGYIIGRFKPFSPLPYHPCMVHLVDLWQMLVCTIPGTHMTSFLLKGPNPPRQGRNSNQHKGHLMVIWVLGKYSIWNMLFVSEAS